MPAAENWITLYEQYASALDAPPHYHTFVAHAVLGCAAGKRAYIKAWNKELYPNLFLILLGASGRARKSTSIDTGTRLLKDVSVPQLVGTASPESIRDELHPDAGGQKEADAWFHIREFGRVLKMSTKDYARDLAEFYCQLYDGNVEGRTKKSGRVLRDDLAVTVFTACPQETLERCLTDEDWSSGFLPRFILVPPPAQYPPINYELVQLDRKLHDALINHLTKLRTMQPHEAAVSPEAKILIITACKEIGNKTDQNAIPSHLWPSIARLQEATWRFALSHACGDLSLPLPIDQKAQVSITVESARVAIRKVAWLVEGLVKLRENFAASPGAASIRKIEKQIKSGREVSERVLLNSNRTVPRREVKDILERLVSEGLVAIAARKPKRGPSKKVYVWCGNGRADMPDDGELP